MTLSDRDWLHEKYVEERLSTARMADMVGAGEKAVCTALQNAGFRVSPNGPREYDLHCGDLDKHRTVLIGEAHEAHLDRDCPALDGAHYELPAGVKQPRRPVCLACTGGGEDRGWQSERVLHELYVRLGWSQREIAETFDVTPSTVSHHLHKHDITTPGVGVSDERLDDPEYLREKYVDEGMTMAEIGEEVGCSDGTVMRRLHDHDIEVRRSKKGDGGRDWASERVLHELHVRLGWTRNEIADAFDVASSTVRYHIDKHALEQPDRRRVAAK